MNKLFILILAIIVASALILGGCAAPSTPAPAPSTKATAQAGPVTIKFAFDMPKTGAIVPGWEWFASELEKRSSGKAKVEFYGAAALFNQKDTPDSLKAGVADVGNIALGTHSQLFPLNYIFCGVGLEFPDLDREGFITKYKAYQELSQKYPELGKELADYKLLFWCPNPAYRIISKNKILVPDDIKGVKLGSPTSQAGAVTKAAGGVWVQAVPNDVYEGINKGVFDGAFVSWAHVAVYKFDEVANYFFDYGFTQEVQQICMNLKAWNSLSPDIQKLIGDLTLETIGRCSDGQIGAAKRGIDNVKAKNKTITAPNAEQRAAWDALVAPMADEWVKAAQAKGFAKAPEFMKDLRALRSAAMK